MHRNDPQFENMSDVELEALLLRLEEQQAGGPQSLGYLVREQLINHARVELDLRKNRS